MIVFIPVGWLSAIKMDEKVPFIDVMSVVIVKVLPKSILIIPFAIYPAPCKVIWVPIGP